TKKESWWGVRSERRPGGLAPPRLAGIPVRWRLRSCPDAHIPERVAAFAQRARTPSFREHAPAPALPRRTTVGAYHAPIQVYPTRALGPLGAVAGREHDPSFAPH